MKALLYKEFKLAMHPICYVFIALFPFMMLIPGYPIAIGFIYILSCYPILFLGANKGQQSNDLLYSTLLPVRKKDIVLARICTVAIMQFAFIALSACLLPLAFLFQSMMAAGASEDADAMKNIAHAGFDLPSFVLVVAIVLVGFAIADLIFFPIYYKKGKSIVMSTLFTILGFVIYLGLFTIGLPYIIGVEKANAVPLWLQFIALAGSLLIYAFIHIFVYKISAKRLEKVDF